MIKLLKNISLILAVFIGCNGGSWAGKIIKPKRGTMLSPKSAASVCYPQAVFDSGSYDGVTDTLTSVWGLNCAQGTVQTPCTIISVVAVYRLNPGTQLYDFLGELPCSGMALDCNQFVIQTLTVTGLATNNGPGEYMIAWYIMGGTCANPGAILDWTTITFDGGIQI